MSAPTTSAAGGTTTTGVNASLLCVNQSNREGPRIPCPTPAPAKPFLEEFMWSIMCLAVFVLFLISCGIMSYWKSSKKLQEVKERKERDKERMKKRIAAEIAEKKREFEERQELAAAGL